MASGDGRQGRRPSSRHRPAGQGSAADGRRARGRSGCRPPRRCGAPPDLGPINPRTSSQPKPQLWAHLANKTVGLAESGALPHLRSRSPSSSGSWRARLGSPPVASCELPQPQPQFVCEQGIPRDPSNSPADRRWASSAPPPAGRRLLLQRRSLAHRQLTRVLESLALTLALRGRSGVQPGEEAFMTHRSVPRRKTSWASRWYWKSPRYSAWNLATIPSKSPKPMHTASGSSEM